MDNKIIVISTGWNCEEYIGRCLDSVQNQKIVNTKIEHHVMVDDKNPLKRMGKVYNFIKLLTGIRPDDEDIILDVDLDDYLEVWAANKIKEVFEFRPNLLLSYGSYRMESGKQARFNGEYKTDDFRNQKWKAGHLKAFRYKLFRQIKIRDFRGPDGRWLMTAGDLAMMFPMMEMAGLDRIIHVKECLYCYNDLNPYNDHKIAKADQLRNERFLRRKPRYKRVEF